MKTSQMCGNPSAMEKCPFCGKEQQQYVPNVYRLCNCEEMSKYVEQGRNIVKIETQIDSLDERIAALEATARSRWEKSNVGKKFRNCTFDTYDSMGHEAQVKACMEYAKAFEENDGQGLMLYGTVGTGKTHLAASIGNYIVYELGYDVYFMPFTEFLNTLKLYMNDKSRAEEFMKRLYKADLLIMDDLGKEKYTEWSAEQLFSLLDRRYRECLPVIVTTNFTPKELDGRVDSAVMSRLAGSCKFIRMNGDDYRRKKR